MMGHIVEGLGVATAQLIIVLSGVVMVFLLVAIIEDTGPSKVSRWLAFGLVGWVVLVCSLAFVYGASVYWRAY